MQIITDTGKGCTITAYARVEDFNEAVEVLQDNQYSSSTPYVFLTNPTFSSISNGVISEDTEAFSLYKQEDGAKSLESSCRAYEQSQLPSTDFALYLQYKDVSPKAQANLDWVDQLWGLYFIAKSREEWDYDFTQYNEPPYSFTEVRLEVGD